MENISIYSKLLAELQQNKNHNSSIERCRDIVKSVEGILGKRVISYFSSEIGNDPQSMIIDDDAFIIENLLKKECEKKDAILILHSNGGYAISAERLIEVFKNYCDRKDGENEFVVVIPKRAKSAATIVALAADKIYLRDSAELGPVDPQFIITDQEGNRQIEPAYLYVDALENIFDMDNDRFVGKAKKILWGNNNKPLSKLPNAIKLKLLEQCNYPVYVNAKNELGLSDSIVDKIASEKIKQNPKITIDDFNIFKDPHITKSHGRLINLADLRHNGLRKQKIISHLSKLSEKNYEDLDILLWELYVRKRQLLNDLGNNIVKMIEDTQEYFVIFGAKQGQMKKPPEKKEDNIENPK